MTKLYDKETGRLLGTLKEEQLRFLIDQLEEESSDDTDYYINKATVEMLVQAGADPELVALLQQGLGEREEMEIRWEEG
jgi:3-methyladenine DNA glycosylase AlkD